MKTDDKKKLSGDMLFENSITAMMLVDSNRTIVKLNKRFCSLFGYTSNEIIGVQTSILTPTVEHFEKYKKYFEQTRDGSYESSELEYKKKSGELFWVKLTGIPIQTGGDHFVLWSFDDVSREVVSREEIRNRYLELEIIFDKVRAGLVFVVDGVIERVNSSFLHMVNELKDNVLGRKITIFFDCFEQCKDKKTKKVIKFHTNKTEGIIVEREIVEITANSYIVICLDVTHHVEEKNVLLTRAQTDGLTSIYNRSTFTSMAQSMINDLEYDYISFIMFDIDHFKMINDTYGHDIGDDVLIELSALLKKYLRTNEIFGRLGGEEFGIIFPTSKENALQIANRLHGAIRNQIFTIKKIHITVSMGLIDTTFFKCI